VVPNRQRIDLATNIQRDFQGAQPSASSTRFMSARLGTRRLFSQCPTPPWDMPRRSASSSCVTLRSFMLALTNAIHLSMGPDNTSRIFRAINSL